MKKKDLNDIANIEKAIKEKYGEEAIQNPKGTWNAEKEKQYLKSLKEFHSRQKREKTTKDSPGFVIKEKERAHTQERTCPVCGSYSFSSRDDLYMAKFECCFSCYIQHIEGRESRWKSGWRPNQ
jgi:hypothetical protein